MKRYLLKKAATLLLCFAVFSLFTSAANAQVGSPAADISATKMNVLYVGVDNPISISVSGAQGEINATMTNGTLVKSGSEWIAKPTAVGKSIVTVTVNGKTIGSMSFRVKAIPNPVAKIAGKSGGSINKGTLAAQISLTAMLEDFDFSLKVQIKSFKMTSVKKGNVTSSEGNGARFTDAQRTQINGLAKGDIVLFTNIKADLPGKPNTELNSIVLTIE